MKSRATGAVAFLVLAGLTQSARAGSGVVALQTADPSCPDDTANFYVNCGNGTVTDNRTGLVWLADANCVGSDLDWHTAMEFVAGLKDISADSEAAEDDCGLSDGSSPGEWRLPSLDEWETMVADADALGCRPTITDDSGGFCWAGGTPGHSFSGVQSNVYWSSTTFVSNAAGAWRVFLRNGFVQAGLKTEVNRLWPVRGGQ